MPKTFHFAFIVTILIIDLFVLNFSNQIFIEDT